MSSSALSVVPYQGSYLPSPVCVHPPKQIIQEPERELNDLFHFLPARHKRFMRLASDEKKMVGEGYIPSELYLTISQMVEDPYYSSVLRRLSELSRLYEKKNPKFKEELRGQINSLRPNELIFVLGGTLDHAVIHVIKHMRENEFALWIVNTGTGGHFIDNKRWALTSSFYGLAKEQLLSEAFLKHCFSLCNVKKKSKDVFEEFEKSMGILLKRAPKNDIPFFAQTHSTCSFSCLEAAMWISAPPKVFLQFEQACLQLVSDQLPRIRGRVREIPMQEWMKSGAFWAVCYKIEDAIERVKSSFV